MIRSNKKFRKGAASFYIVAFSTLILMIVAISFAAVIISEVERTSNDDLAQSAYDSALAGVEDAKLAYYNYLNCKNNSNNEGCGKINALMDKEERTAEDCNMVWEMLGRNGGGAIIESNTGNNMQQATTCITVNDKLKDYKSRMSGGIDVIKVKFKEEENFGYSDVKTAKLSWYSDLDATTTAPNFNNFVNGKVVFSNAGTVATPPTVYFAMVQTGPTFDIDSFNAVSSNETNRGLVYLVPASSISSEQAESYNKTTNNTIKADALIDSNSKKATNLPYVVDCAESGSGVAFLCSATIELPNPVGGERNEDTFMVAIGAPYGQQFDVDLEFYCAGDNENSACITEDPNGGGRRQSPVTMERVQVEVDSTGRANDLYRRVVTRLKNQSDLALSVMGPLELLESGESSVAGLTKSLTVTKEYNFFDPES